MVDPSWPQVAVVLILAVAVVVCLAMILATIDAADKRRWEIGAKIVDAERSGAGAEVRHSAAGTLD